MDVNYSTLKWIKTKFSFLFLCFALILESLEISASQVSCDKTREVFSGVTYGKISHGDYFNYTQDSHCEWLIKAENNSQFITLKFSSFKTECAYDYLFIYDGLSYSNASLLGSFSGMTFPDEITARSGFMLIMLYSDTNYVLDGFHAEFHITSCLMNCSNNGLCVNHKCNCDEGWTGEDCSEKICDCGEDENRGVCSKKQCHCTNGWSGHTCSLHKTNSESSQWIWLTKSHRSFTKRTAHTAVYHEATDSIFIFGGYDLNNVLSKMEVFRFNTSQWEVINQTPDIENQQFFSELFEAENSSLSYDSMEENKSEPSPRYGHASCLIRDSFIIFGGKLANRSLSNELWVFNISTNQWTLRAANSNFQPPKLVRHSVVHVKSNDYIYVFGGALESSEFSSRLFRIKIEDDPSVEQWEEVFPKGGKTMDFRIVAHSCNFHEESNSLLIFGGIIANGARVSKLSDRIFSFDLKNEHWTEIFYPKSVQSNIPRERAFHSATIVGSYLILFGGYSHRHNKEEICYDNQMYFYHLGCHYWISQDVLGANRSSYPKKQGVFSHAAVLRGDNALIIIGGYHGIVNNDLLAFTLPDALIVSKNLTDSEKCLSYKSSNECIANPECGWCSSDQICYGRSMSNCYTNLQTTRCPGICHALKDCQSCLIHGTTTRSTTKNKLPIEECTWCVQNAKCHQRNDRVPCGESDSVEKLGNQWWGRSGDEIGNKNQCTKLDKPPGLTLMKYYYPFNLSTPDYVSIVNSTSVDFSGSMISPHQDPMQANSVLIRLLGFLRLPANIREEILRLCGSYAQIILETKQNGETKIIANFTVDQNFCNSYVFERKLEQKIFIELQAKRRLSNAQTLQHNPSKVSLQNNSTKTFTFEFLEPFVNGSCSQYSNCMQCLSDSACGWCDLKMMCLSRDIDEEIHCKTQDKWRFLITQSDKCENCSNFVDCESCTDANCEWMSDEAKCLRAGRYPLVIQKSNKCPSPCYQRNNCTTCLNQKGRCVWCEATQECFSFSVYTSEFQYGLCREWIDLTNLNPTNSLEHHQCKSCSALTNCSDCLKSLSCGWCYFRDKPIEGKCISGDFNSSLIDCNLVLNTTEAVSYTYASCPDFDECSLNIHDCNENADCINTHGSYKCECRRGYTGDGRKCEKTCIETCHEGRCSNDPDYKCICDLGWTGSDCSIDCGCNNHSTCRTGVGKCDECQDYTEGEFCERCIVGSYGNATNSTGCMSCNCNGHGDPMKGYCDQTNGKCFCQTYSATEGDNCEDCIKNYYGDPRNSGKCFLKCQGRSMLSAVDSQGIGSFESRDDTSECLWMLKLNNSVANGSLIQIEVFDMNISCYNNALYIYNSLMDMPEQQMQKRLLNYICRDQQSSKIIEESKSGEMSIYFRRRQNGEGFNAVVTILSCQLRTCRDPYKCDSNMNCVCPRMWTGVRCEIEICPKNCSKSLNQGYCDLSNNRCICLNGFAGEDCSKVLKKTSISVTEIFNTRIVPQQFSHLKKTLPRFGHTLNIDRRGFLWIFGGFSISNGALNDVRSFDSKNHSWMQVTVDGSEAKMPVGRYFHASVISKQGLYTYGGLSNGANLLNDFWMFNLQEHRWTEIKSPENPGFIAGHTLNIVKVNEHEKLILIGGISNHTDATKRHILWEYSFDSNSWKKLNFTGFTPIAIYSHTTIYHASTQVLYIFGGIQMVYDKMRTSKRLFSLNYHPKEQIWRFSLLPTFNDINRPDEFLPRARFMHSAVSFRNYMVIFGGESSPENSSDFFNSYVFKCNMWTRLTESVNMIGHTIAENFVIGQAVAIDENSETNSFYLVGGKELKFSILKISLPSDICELWGTSKALCRSFRGCSFGQVITENTKSIFCYSSDNKENRKNEVASSFHYGLSCDEVPLSRRNCSSFEMCEECEAVWPDEIESSCQWCNSKACGKNSRKCVSRSNLNETERISSSCFNSYCSSFDCVSCALKPGCNWTRVGDSFKCLSKERSMQENLETFPECPEKCEIQKDCLSCLTAISSEGGHGDCIWSTKLKKCFSQSYKSLTCSGGNCGMVLNKAEVDQCPLRCESYQMCSKCLQNSNCGWCSKDDDDLGDGVCIDGNINGPFGESEEINAVCNKKYEESRGLQGIRKIFSKISEQILKKPVEIESKENSLDVDVTTIATDDILNLKSLSEKLKFLSNISVSEVENTTTASNSLLKSFVSNNQTTKINVPPPSTFSWNYLTCPPENECQNDHHTCNRKTEKCTNLFEGFICECAEGYESAEDSNDCVPICDLGCDHGQCIEPNTCECDFGFVGKNCSVQCQCSGHSQCAGPDKLDVCTECKNNTIGKQCEKCDKFFVGDPRNNGKCQSCFDYCHGHSDICVAEFREEYRNMSKNLLSRVLTEGARANAICLSCQNNTNGSRCDSCLSGYFRGTTNLRDSCRRCQCNGHGDVCDPVSGEKCNCGNNTESDNTCPSKFEKNSIFHCWMTQCTKCKESYSGHPKNGHQCYKHITIDAKMCLDAQPYNLCQSQTHPLKGGKTVFFVVQPRFMNVDIRITLDVTVGEIDFFMSSNDDSFVVLTNQSNNFHEVFLDSKYQWIQEFGTDDYSENLNITPLVTASKKSFENISVPHGFSDDRLSSDCRSLGKFFVLDKTAHRTTTHIKLEKCNTLLRVFGLKNRLVVTLPQNVWNLSGTRFFIAIRAANSDNVTGLLFFRQDQLHIDLFVFFSVFFSCFFLFLAFCVALWKAKHAADLRQARRRHVVEMITMAQRPFSNVILDSTIDSLESQTQKTSQKTKTLQTSKKDMNICPIAIETTANNQAAICTVFIRLPQTSTASGYKQPVCFGSSLIIQPKSNIFLNKPPARISQQNV